MSRRLIILILLIITATTGCGVVAQPEAAPPPQAPGEPQAAAPSEAEIPAPAEAPAANTEIVLAIETDILETGDEQRVFDPIYGWGNFSGSLLFHSTLLHRDANLNVVNDLATDYSVSQDGRVWTFQLRPDARFSDGEPVTAKDVAFTFQKAAEVGIINNLDALEKAVATSDTEVELHLKEPRSTFIHQITRLGIVPEHAYDEAYAVQPIGSGPYKLVTWDEGNKLVVEANPYYYGQPPNINHITILFAEESVGFAAAKAGKVHVANVSPRLAVEQVAGMKLYVVKSVDNRGLVFPCLPDTGQKTADGFSIGNNIIADQAVRQAINFAIDREALVREVLDGYGSPAYTSVSGLAWEQPEAIIADGDPEQAKRILAQAGWNDTDGDGIVEKEGLKAEFILMYPKGDITRQALAEAVATMLKPVGLLAEPVAKDWDEIDALKHSQVVLFGWGSFDPGETYLLYHSSTGGSWENPGYCGNAITDAYIDQAMQAPSEAEAIGFWQKAQWDGETGFSARGEAAWAWLVNVDHTYFISECLDIGTPGIEPHGHGWPITANIAEWKWTCN